MFADEVIEFLIAAGRKTEKVLPDYQDFKTGYEGLIPLLKNSQKFFLGDGFRFLETLGLFDAPMSIFADADDLRLPYQTCWFSCRAPSFDDGAVTKIGVLATELAEDFLQVAIGYHSEPTSWMVIPVHYYISTQHPIVEHPIFKQMTNESVLSKIDPATHIHGRSYAELPGNKLNIEKYFNNNTSTEQTILPFVLLEMALKLLHCKNITTETTDPPEKVNKKRRKKGKQELFTYHTLVLKPVGKTQQSIPKHLWENRIHLQRGHFKTYTKDNPLFGKITGRFWWQPHVRGQNKSGIVLKDYEFDVSEYTPGPGG